MRKLFLLLMCIYLGIGLMGCEKSEEIPSDVEESNSVEESMDTEEGDSIEYSEINEQVPEETIPRENPDFRQAVWGDDMPTVVKYEGEDCEKTESVYMYERKVAGYDAYALYRFEDDQKLHSAVYNFKDEYTVGKQYITQYNVLKDALTEKYGTPYLDEIVPQESQDMIDLAGEGDSLKFGYVVYVSQWKTSTTNISLSMSAINYDIGIIIMYEDLNYEFRADTEGL